VFFVLLLTKEGKEACKDCFTFQDGEDAPEPDYKWCNPNPNIHKAYKPPIIREEYQNATVVGDNNSEDGSNVEVNDDALSDEEWMYDTDDDDDNDFIIEGGKKKKIEKTMHHYTMEDHKSSLYKEI
jgi:hypothetical protein